MTDTTQTGEVQGVVALPNSGGELGGVAETRGGTTPLIHLSGILVDALGNEIGNALLSTFQEILEVQKSQLLALSVIAAAVDKDSQLDDFLI